MNDIVCDGINGIDEAEYDENNYIPYDCFTNDITISFDRHNLEPIYSPFSISRSLPGLKTLIKTFDYVGVVKITDSVLELDVYICDLIRQFDKLIILKYTSAIPAVQLLYLKNLPLWNMYDEYSVLDWSLVVHDTNYESITSSWFRLKPFDYGKHPDIHKNLYLLNDVKQLEYRRYTWMYDRIYKQIAKYCLEAQNKNDVRSFLWRRR